MTTNDSNCDDEPFFQRPDVFTQGHVLPVGQGADYLTSTDMNGDGTLDLIVGQPTADNNTGKLFWVDGTTTADFSELDGTTNLWTGSTEGSEFGSSAVLIDDMNGNGTPDIMIGAPGEGKVYLFDSNTVSCGPVDVKKTISYFSSKVVLSSFFERISILLFLRK